MQTQIGEAQIHMSSPFPESQRLKIKSDMHLSRKLTHAMGICLITLIYNIAPLKLSWTLLLSLSFFIIPLDYLRLKQPGLNRFTIKILGWLMRRNEYTSLTGTTYLLLGVMALLLLNERHVVTLSLLFLAIGDPIASYFGLRFGTDKILGSKTLQGTAAAFAACSVISVVYYYHYNLMTERLLIVVPLSGFIGAAAELIPIGKLDDNFTIPVVGAGLLWVLFFVYGGFSV